MDENVRVSFYYLNTRMAEAIVYSNGSLSIEHTTNITISRDALRLIEFMRKDDLFPYPHSVIHIELD